MPDGVSPLPTDLLVTSRDLRAMQSLPVINGAEAADGSPFYYPGGFITVLTEAAGPANYLDAATDLFRPEVAYGLVKILELCLKLREIRARQRELDKESEKDIRHQLGVEIYKKNQQEAVKHFAVLATREGEANPRGLLYQAVTKYLQRYPGDANVLFRKFERRYVASDPVAHALVQLRFAKSLSAVGDFRRARKRYHVTIRASALPPMIRAQTARECCNVVAQLAWDHPEELASWDSLRETVNILADALDELRSFRGRKDEKQIIAFLRASRDEFAVLADVCGRLNQAALRELEGSIERQCKFSPITGRNRNTQLAAGYLRAGIPERASYLARRFQRDMTDPLERGLTHFVNGQALLLMNKPVPAAKSMAAAASDLDRTATPRFRRVLGIYLANLDPKMSRIRRLGFYLWPFRGAPRHVGAFVPEIPRLTI